MYSSAPVLLKRGSIVEPVTTVGMSALGAYLSKDSLNKLLGPTAEYLGEGLKDLAKKRIENIEKIFRNAQTKLGERVNSPGIVPPKVLKTIIDEGSYCEDQVAVEYFGGVLASSRSQISRDDRGATIAKVLEGLSTYQIRTHYIFYSYLKKLFNNSGYHFNLDDRKLMNIFIPASSYGMSMQFNEDELEQFGLISRHCLWGLNKENLIGEFLYGNKDKIQTIYPKVQSDGLIIAPSASGAELYLWGFGYGDKNYNFILTDEMRANLEEIPLEYDGVIPVSR